MEKSKKRILIVDDDAMIRRSFKEILQRGGYIVDTAPTGAEAIQKSFTEFYNLALIDIRLPDMDGIKLLTEMKETTPKMRKIIVTGFPDLQNAIAAIRGAADDYLTKPASADSLLQAIEKNLRIQQGEGEYSQQKVADYIENRVRELELNDDDAD